MSTKRLQQIDKLALPDHYFLTESDVCIYWGEYTARAGFGFSETNGLISNLKKKMDRKGRPEWRYKLQAIATASAIFAKFIRADALKSATLVPMPPSKIASDAAYDDRMLQVVRGIAPGLDVRELIKCKKSDKASHERSDRPSPQELKENMYIDSDLIKPTPTQIFLFDDVLTTGAHFVAAKEILNNHFPGVSVLGIFVARRVPETVEFDAITDPDEG